MGVLLLIIGVLTAVIGALGMTYRPLRYMEDELPNPYAESIITRSDDPESRVLFDPDGEVALA